MKKELRIREGETLGDWRARLVEHYASNIMSKDDLSELLHVVSVTSYTHGSNDALGITRKQDEWYKTKFFKPEQNQVVVGFWDKRKKVSLLCYYDHDDDKWYEANPDTDGAPLKAPDYWRERPH